MFRPDPDRFYCVRCLAGAGQAHFESRSFESASEVRDHLSFAHHLPPSRQQPEDWIAGARAVELLAERPDNPEERVFRFTLYLAGCFGVDDLIADRRRRPELGC